MKNDTLYFHTCGICSRLWPQHCTELVLTKLVYLTRGLPDSNWHYCDFLVLDSDRAISFALTSLQSSSCAPIVPCKVTILILFLLQRETYGWVGGREGSCAFKCSNRVMLQWRLHVPVLQRGGTIGWPLIRPCLCLLRT